MKKPLTKELLKTYDEQKLSQKIIAAKTGWSVEVVGKRMREVGIHRGTGWIGNKRKKAGDVTLITVNGIKMLEAFPHPTKKSRWKVKCLCRCGKIFVSNYQSIKRQETKSCGCYSRGRKSKWDAFRQPQTKSPSEQFEHITESMIKSYVDGALKRGITWNVTLPELEKLYFAQGGRCALSGVPLTLPTKSSRKGVTASLDRKDSSKAYVGDNLQWVHKDLNRMKGVLSDEEFIEWCVAVSMYARPQLDTTVVQDRVPCSETETPSEPPCSETDMTRGLKQGLRTSKQGSTVLRGRSTVVGNRV